MASEIKVDTISEKTSANGITIDGVNIKDSALATAGSVPLSTIDIDGGTDIGAAIVDADLFIIDDGAGGTNRKVAASRIKTYAGGSITALNNATANELVTIGSTTTELDAETNLTFSGSALQCTATLTVGVDDTGHDVKYFGATSGSYWSWDESADEVKQIGKLTVGVDDAGHDVKFFGDTASAYMLWDASADDLILGGSAGLGIITAKDLGIGIHVREADSSASAANNADSLVIENSASCGMSILSGTSSDGNIVFGDSGDDDIGMLKYDHSVNDLRIFVNAAERVRITGDAGLSTAAETAPDTGPHGICIQGAGDNGNFITFKGDAVAHSFTSIAEADTFVQMAKYDNGQGGLRLRAFTEEHQAINLIAYIDASDARNGEATNQGGAIGLQAYGDTGTGAEALGADDNIFTVASAALQQFIVKGDGELFSNQSATVGTYDNYDDAQLVRAYDLSRGKEMKGLINSKFDKFIKYNQKDLMDARLIGRVKDEKGDYQPTDFVNLTGMSRLHNGAIWQQYEKHERLLEAVYDLAKEAVGEDKANAILEKHEVKRLQQEDTMAITANVDLGNDVSASSCYIIVPNARVIKNEDDSFSLVYNVDIYKDASDRATNNISKQIRCRAVDHHKTTYDPTSGEQNAFKLAYADLKTNSKLSSVADAQEIKWQKFV